MLRQRKEIQVEYNLEEYKEKVQLIHEEKERAIGKLNIEFAKANNPYKVGDKVTDHIGTILIEKISVSAGAYNRLPCCVYFGPELKKDGEPKKSNAKRDLWQSNIEKL